ncbi:hypothetical protein GPECTOR_1g136 [Gonium pectorale]|uniref:Protein kinase domain-containing protein n=1 Tax=Gonium pectorale TaxID=33097 RepID=A0A150H1Z3_GONPE|nr:hypothetical protein GPECTOR_1g136 [Gonium pectorale]|eukprot:KXZ56159.1 hypothetical protein GPECTOR_1g136 [Gonium pectorale]
MQLPVLQPLLERLRLYAEVTSTGKLQLLRTTIEGLSCDDLHRLYLALGLLRSAYSSIPAMSGSVKPEVRYIYPYLFIKYAQIATIWMEDVTISCAATADLSPAACPLEPPTVYNVSSYDEFMAALTALEATDVPTCVTHRTILQLTTNVALDVSRWPRQTGGMYITSNVTIQGVYGQSLMLDFGGGLDLFRIRAGAFVQINDLVLANLPLSPVGAYVVPLWSFQFKRDLILLNEGRLHLVNTTGVVPKDEFIHLQYWTTILTNPTEAIAALAAWQRLIQRMDLVAMTSSSLTFYRLCGMGITGYNIQITSQTFGLKLVVPETGVNQLLGTDFRVGPPYIIAIYNAGQMARALSMPDSAIARLAEQDGMTNGNTTRLLLLLQSNITLDRAAWPPDSALQLRRQVVVQGKPFTNVALDFGRGTNYVTLTSSGVVMFKHLVLRNAGWAADYTAATALQQLTPSVYLQSGMWVVTHDRTGQPRVILSSATLLVSRHEIDVLLTCMDTLAGNTSVKAAGNVGALAALPPSLTPDSCESVWQRDAQVASVNRSLGLVVVGAMHLDAFDAEDVLFAVDPGVDRPDLLALLTGSYPITSAAPPVAAASGNGGADNGPIIGGAVGGAAGAVVLVALGALYVVRRNRKRERDTQLRNLQAKQAHQLEELAGTNPLAQMILDHLAGRDPGVTRLVVNGGAGSGGVAVAVAAPGVGNVSGGAAHGDGLACGGGQGSADVVCTASTTPSANSNASPCKAASGGACSSSGPVAGSEAKPSAGVGSSSTGELAVLREMPLNIAAADLAELFKHLTILGTPATAAVAASSADSRGRHSPSAPSVSGSANGAPQSGFTFTGFTLAMVQRLQRRSTQAQPAARDLAMATTGSKAQACTTASLAAATAGGMVAANGGSQEPPQGAAIADSAGRGNGTSGVGKEAGAEGGQGGAVRGSDVGTAPSGGSGCADKEGGSEGEAVPAAPSLPQELHEHLTQSPVLEELLRLSVDLAGEIDDNQLMVTDVVASGGFGTVYKGTWHNLPVAVKIVLFSTASVNRRIALQEAALSKSICHPNIISTYAVDAKPMTVLGRNGGSALPGGSKPKSLADIQEWRLYIIQEFADGGTLRRSLDKGAFHEPYSGLPYLDMLLDIAQGVAAALAHLHSKNVVHGDLNPKNVLLKVLPGLGPRAAGTRAPGWLAAPTGYSGKASVQALQYIPPPGQAAAAAAAAAASGTQLSNYPLVGRCGFAIKVADFGLSVKLADASHISGLRQGTPFYASPELSQQGIFSRAADVYAFGVLLWELYWGRPIWVPDANAAGGYVQHVNFPHLPPDCPSEYGSLLTDCLQLNHLQRPCFEEVLMRLRLIAAGVLRAAEPAGGCGGGTIERERRQLP